MIAGPWYITVSAVKELMVIKGLRVADDGPDFDACEDDLVAQARAIVDSGKAGRELDSGAIQYRGGRPLRLRLTVMPAPRREGSLPQLVRVQPDHEARRGPYTQSSPERQTGHDKRDKRRP